MIRWMWKAALSMLSMAALLYCVFFVPVGQRTLYAHLQRIAETEEARELGTEVATVVKGAGEKVVSQFGNPVAPPPD